MCRLFAPKKARRFQRNSIMKISDAIEKMIAFYNGNLHDINHFLKVWAYARNIGEQEGLDARTQETLELAAVVHDISCPLCRKKYGDIDGKHQEQESRPLVEAFFAGEDCNADVERIAWLAAHHHTYTGIDGMDYRILLEAGFLVNADESGYTKAAIENAKKQFFRTDTGLRLLNDIYLD